MAGVLDGARFHTTVVVALRLAAVARAPAPVDTGDLLVALMRADGSGDWSRICLDTGDADAIERKGMIDRPSRGAGRWENARLTDQCAIALDVSGRLATRYRLWPIPVGLVVLGLIADESAAAARALHSGLQRRELLDRVQSDVLGSMLDGIEYTLPTVLREAGGAPYAAQPVHRPPPPPRAPSAPRTRNVPHRPAPYAEPGKRESNLIMLAAVAIAGIFVFVLAMALREPHTDPPARQPNFTLDRPSFVQPTFPYSRLPTLVPPVLPTRPR
ncbi:hypothetical protein ACWEOI_34970 [Nocardia sp. NPDC004340]|uniref:hypothetical protein n=1 Tax=Nocardia sp. CA-136227 TaxID=3239979 RepID=UPI003D98ECAF